MLRSRWVYLFSQTSDLSSLISSDSSLDWLDIKTISSCRTKIGSCFRLCYSVAAGVSPSSVVDESRSTLLGDRLLARTYSSRMGKHLLFLTKIRFTREGLAESKGCLGYRSRGCPCYHPLSCLGLLPGLHCMVSLQNGWKILRFTFNLTIGLLGFYYLCLGF